MSFKKVFLFFVCAAFVFASCQGSADSADDQGSSTPIDSTNDQGTAPATYGADNPANVQDTTFHNSNDTGTRVNMGPDNTPNN